MIIGNGDIATALREIPKQTERKNWIYFASGVSNSQEKRESEYEREIKLLLKQDKNKHLVYISSLCVFYSNSRYAKHKKQMEKLIKDNFERFTIMRFGTITWGNNPHTLINFFRYQKKRGKKLTIRDTYRYIVDKDEFLHWIRLIPDWDCEMNVTGKRMKVKEIVRKYVK